MRLPHGSRKSHRKGGINFSPYFSATFFRTSSTCSSSRTMIPKCRVRSGWSFSDFEDGQELVLAELKKRIAFAALQLLQVEHILVELHRRLHIIHLDGQMVTPINVHAHERSYLPGVARPTPETSSINHPIRHARSRSCTRYAMKEAITAPPPHD